MMFFSLLILVEFWFIFLLIMGFFFVSFFKVIFILDLYWVIWLWIFLFKFLINFMVVILFLMMLSFCIMCFKVKKFSLIKSGGGFSKCIMVCKNQKYGFLSNFFW